MLGLSYKPNTDVVEESPGLLLVRELAGRGVDVVGHDPAANENAERALAGVGRLAHSLEDALASADAVVIATAWDEFRGLAPSQLERDGRHRVVIDCWRLLPREQFEQVVDYVVLGEGALSREAVVRD